MRWYRSSRLSLLRDPDAAQWPLDYGSNVIAGEGVDEIRSGGASFSTGSVNLNTAPRGTLALAHSRPRCASMIERLIAMPIPVRAGLMVWKASKRRWTALGIDTLGRIPFCHIGADAAISEGHSLWA